MYILTLDHGAWFASGMLGWNGVPKSEQIAQITAAKRVIYDGFTAAVADGVDKNKWGILVYEHFGAKILRDAKRSEIMTCAPAEKRGRTSSTSSSATNSRGTSRPSRRPFARCWCTTTMKAMRP